MSVVSGIAADGSNEKTPRPGRDKVLCWYKYLPNNAESFKFNRILVDKVANSVLRLDFIRSKFKHEPIFAAMTSEQEKEFIQYWESVRDHQGKLSTQFFSGIPIGLLFAVPVFIILVTARFWFKRADMVANAKLDTFVFGIAVFLITVFVAVFYKRFQWEQKEQQYQEFKVRQKPS